MSRPAPTLGNPQNTIEILNKYKFVFQKKYGQNFLIDSHVLEKIIRAAQITEDDFVVEIGPGIGTMTQYLAASARGVAAIEIDRALIPILQDTLSAYDNVTVMNEDVMKVDLKKLAEEMNGRFGREVFVPMGLDGWREIPKGSYLCLQTTSVGMAPRSEEILIRDEEFYKMIHTGFDIIYTPFETSFMKAVRQAGGRAFNGLSMLIYQGVIAYELWNPEVKIRRETVARIRKMMMDRLTGKKGNVIFIGFMGAGKTTVGQAYARKFSMPFVDTDELIEREAGRSISDIFASEGEEAFRRMETETVRKLREHTEHAVISVGGGLPLREENRRLLRETGTVVYLKIRPETVCSRLAGDDSRPMMRGGNPEERARELLDAREEFYEAASHFSVETDGKTVEEIVEEVGRKGNER